MTGIAERLGGMKSIDTQSHRRYVRTTMAEPIDENDENDPDLSGLGGAGDEDARGDALPHGVKQRLEALIPEIVKKTFAAGMGAVFTTEEGIRRITKDMTLPKEVAGYLASTAGNTKDEIVRIVAGEVRDFLQTVNLSEEIAKILTTLSFEIKTEIRFIPNEEKYQGAVKPDVKAKVRLKRAEDRPRKRRRSDEPEEGGPDDE